MKTPDQVVDDVRRRLSRTWASELVSPNPPPPHRGTDARTDVGPHDSSIEEQEAAGSAWPHAFPIGQPTGRDLSAGFTDIAARARSWRSWAGERTLELRWRSRAVLGTSQELPTHLLVPDVDTAASLVGDPWPDTLTRGRARLRTLTTKYAHLSDPARTLRSVDSLTDVDFDLLCRAGDWFATHDATGMTPRQVPVEGLHAKWLNTRHALVAELAGVTDLRLAPPHPARIHFTYLDPTHLAAGRRRHDSATVGDHVDLPYEPTVVLISENKDTAIGFPPVPGAVAVEGVGRGGRTAASFAWLTNATHIFYWGDMDADGMEILNEFRAAGIQATSLLMTLDAYRTWERFGVHHDPQGRPLTGRSPRLVPHLTPDEADLYQHLIGAGDHVRRIEQERIPLSVALDELSAHLT